MEKEVDETPIELTTYYFLLNRSGICIGYATSYIYLLLQAGIDAINVSGMPQSVLDGQPGTPHDWVMMKIDGEYPADHMRVGGLKSLKSGILVLPFSVNIIKFHAVFLNDNRSDNHHRRVNKPRQAKGR